MSCKNGSEIFEKTILITEGTNMAVALSPDNSQMVIDVLGQLWLLPEDGGETIPLTDGMGNARQPDWSPDGEMLAFQAYWEGNWHIYTMDMQDLKLQRLTSGDFDHREPSWSPDGKELTFSTDLNGSYDLYRLDLETRQMIRLTDSESNEYAPSWSPDGDRIAYVSDHPGKKGIREIIFSDGSENLLYNSENDIWGVNYTTDAGGISFVEMSFQSTVLNYVDLSSEEVLKTQLSREGQDVFPFRAQWINENSFIYTADGRIIRQSIDEGMSSTIPFEAAVSVARQSYPLRRRSFDAAKDLRIKGIAWPDLSPDGRSVACVSLGDLWIVQNGSSRRLTTNNHLEMVPEWSPDGQKLAFVSDMDGDFALYTMDVAGIETTRIASLPGDVAGLDWSSDGNKIAFSSSFGPRLGRLSYIDLLTGRIRHVSPMLSSSPGAPSWSPDNQSLICSVLKPYSSLYREGINGIVRYSLDGRLLRGIGDLHQISVGVRSKDGPVWSPDGRFIAAVSSGQLILLPMKDGGIMEDNVSVVDEGPADVPSWSGDGKTMAYLSGNELRILQLETGIYEVWDPALDYDRSAPNREFIIQCGKLFTAADNKVLEDMDILISENRIKAIMKREPSAYPADAEVIDARSQFVMPGLIDCHAHQGSWGGKAMGRAWLSWGVTSTRDPASDPYDALNRKEGMESGNLIGPRIFFTGSPLDGNRIYYGGASTHTDTSHILREIQKAVDLDYDLIKTYVRLPDPLQRLAVEKAHDAGLPVTSHELFPAVVYGMDGVEHILGTSRRGYSPKMTHLGNAYSDVTDLIAGSGISFTPTSGIYSTFQFLISEDSGLLDDQRLSLYADAFMIDNVRRGMQSVKDDKDRWKQYVDNSLKMVLAIYEKGGHVVAGTDSPIIPYGFGLHLELMAYKKAGVPALDVLHTATSRASKTLGASDDLGTLEVGKLADILILNEDPRDDIKHTMDVDKVIINGIIWDQSQLAKQ